MILCKLTTHPINGVDNPKDYPEPYRNRLYSLLPHVVKIDKIESLENLENLIKQADYIITIDSFLQHLAWYYGKQAIVLWGQSDPNIFGHKENINLLKDTKYLRDRQFWLWSQTPVIPEAFVEPEEILKYIRKEGTF